MDYYEKCGRERWRRFLGQPSTAKVIIPAIPTVPGHDSSSRRSPQRSDQQFNLYRCRQRDHGANAAAQYNTLDHVNFYAGPTLVGSVSNIPYTITATGLAAGSYALKAVAVDGSGSAALLLRLNITVKCRHWPALRFDKSPRPRRHFKHAPDLCRLPASVAFPDRRLHEHPASRPPLTY